MIETIEAYRAERYEALEAAFLEQAALRLGNSFQSLSGECLGSWQEAMGRAAEVQEGLQPRPACAYMSISLLLTSVAREKPVFQIDFFNEDWFYGWPFARSYADASFLFAGWERFQAEALDERYFTRSRLRPPHIKKLFWGTADRLVYLFAAFAKYMAPELEQTEAYQALARAPEFFVTCGSYLDWQERLWGVRPVVPLLGGDEDAELSFRSFTGEIYREAIIPRVSLPGSHFRGCLFAGCTFAGTDLRDARFTDCRFYDTVLQGVRLAGADFSGCTFRRSRIEQADTDVYDEEDAYYGEWQLRGCRFEKTVIEDSDLRHVRLAGDFQAKELSLVNVQAEDASLLAYCREAGQKGGAGNG